jgi:HTTM domain/Vitamin K-dependent gamma-carboxylase, lumenal domain
MTAAIDSPAIVPTERRSKAPVVFERLFVPVDAGFLIYFRIVFGLVMLLWVVHYFQTGWIELLYIQPRMHFTWPGFGWVKPWPAAGMRVHFLVMGLLAAFIAAGFLYRASALLFALAFTQLFLIDKTHYQNHYYLITLVSWLMVFLPANCAASLDAVQRPAIRSSTVPAWTLWLLRFQIGLPYFFGGIAKLDSDWLHGQPMRMVLAGKTWYPLIGRFFTEEWMVQFFVWGGLAFDLLIVPALLWRRTRAMAFAVSLVFHLLNATLFSIGVFPWFMMLATVVFFDPAWPRRMLGTPRTQGFGKSLGSSTTTTRRRVIAALLAVYVAVHLALPLRHLLYQGDVNWNERGHAFSWHMLVRGKQCAVRCYVHDAKTGKTVLADLRNYLTMTQAIHLGRDPELLRFFAHHLADDFRRNGFAEPQVYVLAIVSLNGRKPELMIDPTVDLAAEEDSWRHPAWILPQTEPFRHDQFDAPVQEWPRYVHPPKLPFESRNAFRQRKRRSEARM